MTDPSGQKSLCSSPTLALVRARLGTVRDLTQAEVDKLIAALKLVRQDTSDKPGPDPPARA